MAKNQKQEAEIMHSIFSRHDKNCIIVCGPSPTVDGSIGNPIKEFAREHPVIYLTRDAHSISQYLRVHDDSKIERLLHICGLFYRASSNIEFFNLTEVENKHSRSVSSETTFDKERTPRGTPFLTLKDVEHDFVRLLRHITGGCSVYPSADATSPLANVPLELRDFTYAVSVPLCRLEEEDLDVEDLALGCDAFEICINSLDDADMVPSLSHRFLDSVSRQFARVRRHTVVPIVLHVDFTSVQHFRHATNGDEVQAHKVYVELVHHGLRLGADYVTVDLSLEDAAIQEVVANKGFTKVIGHAHDERNLAFNWNSNVPVQLYERARSLGCDAARLSKVARSIEDNFAVARFVHQIQELQSHQSKLPLVAYNTGLLGRMSCCYNSFMTPVTHVGLKATRTTSSRSLHATVTVLEAQEALFKSFVSDPLQFYIFGGNITHSLSPPMHNSAFKACGMPHHYSIVQESSLRPLIALIERDDFGGCSVGLPFKLEVITLVNSLSPSAKAIGAVNTLVPIRDGPLDEGSSSEVSLHRGRNRAGRVKALHGHNTDWIGIMNTIRAGLSPVNAVGPITTGLVVGAGGMARASVYAMLKLGVRNIFIHNRTVENAQRVANHFQSQDIDTLLGRSSILTSEASKRFSITVLVSSSDPWPSQHRQPTMIVSTVPSSAPEGAPVPNFRMPEQWLQSTTGGVVVELAYKPLVTPLMRQMRAANNLTRGWIFFDGLDVLPQQAFVQFEVFTDRRAPQRLMKAEVLRAYRIAQGGIDDEAGVSQRLENIESPAVA